MVDQNLVNYVKDQLKNGYAENKIIGALVKQGWDQKTISEVMDAAKNTSSTPSKASSTSKDYAGFWLRFSAMIWDMLILGIPSTIIQVIVLIVTKTQSMMYLVTLATVALTIYLDGTKGGTPGKLLLGLKIKNEKGRLIGIPMAILRYIGKMISGMIMGIGYLMIAWDKKKQGLHDKIAKTYVIKEKERKGLFITGIVIGVLFVLIIPILIVSVASLAFFSIMQPDNFLPSSCRVTGMTCEDFKTTADGITVLQLTNNLGQDLKNVIVTLEGSCTPEVSLMKVGDKAQFTCQGTPGEAGEMYTEQIEVGYLNADDFPQSTFGSLMAKIE